MIDNFTLALCHGLLLLAAWRLLSRPDLEDDDASSGDGPKGWWRKSGASERPGA